MFTSSPSTIMHNYKKSNLNKKSNLSLSEDVNVANDLTQGHRQHEPSNRISNVDTPLNHPNPLADKGNEDHGA